MNEELEKNFLEEIKPLIDTYVRDRNQKLDDLNIEGRKAIIEELKPRREQRLQNLKQEIYDKTKAFIKEAKEKSIEEKNSLIMEKERQLDEAKDNLRSKYVYSKNTIQLRNMAKTISDVAYKSADDMLQIAVNELRQANEAYKELQEEYNRTKKLDAIELLDERYRNIDFESEKGIEDIINIIKERQEKDLSNKPKDKEQTINNPRIHETSDDIKVASIEEVEKRRQGEVKKAEEEQENEENKQKDEKIKQIEDQEEQTGFKKINPDEVDIITPPKVLTRADLENEEEQDDSSLNEQDEVDEEKRKQEEEQMWEEYNKEQEEKREQEEEQMWEKYNKQQEKETKRVQEIDEQRNKNKEEKKKIREKKEEFFNNKEKFYEDLLKEDLPYQALKERLINTYTLPQLGKALNEKSLVEIYELYVKQVNKNIKDSMTFEEGLTQEEIDAKIAEKLDDEELKTTLSVRLEILKERQKEIKDRQEQERKAREQYNKREEQATKFFENIEKKYGIDLLPTVYLKDKTELISKYANGENTELLNNFKFLEYCEEQFKILEGIMNEQTVEQEEIDDYNDLQDQIQYIRAKALELGEIPPHIQEIKEKLVNLCKKEAEGYEDLLPSLYYDEKSEMIKESMDYYMGNPDEAKTFFERYKEIYEKKNIEKALTECRKIEKEFEKFGSYVKENKEIATDEEIYELRNAIQQIEKRKYIKENAYKETKIVVEPYNDRIMIYLKGEVEPRERKDLAQLMKDGKNLYKSGSDDDGRNLKGLVRGIEKGNYAIIAVLSELGIAKGQDYIEGYTHMFAGNPEKTSEIDSIVYDFTNEDGKIQSQKMIKTMQKYAKTAEKYGVAESIGRKKGIIEEGTNGLKSFFGKRTEKVLALGEGIKNFHPIGNAIENRRAKKYSKDREVDISKTTSTYNEWRAKMDTSYEVWREKMGEGAPTLEDQAENARIFRDSSKQESKTAKFEHEKQGDYDIYSFYE